MDWDKLRIFQAAADAGSFTHAGETLGLSQSAVSRQVGALEADLGAPLFHRHARGLILTEQGEMLLDAVRDVVLKLDAVRSRLIDSREKPTGELRVTSTLGLGANWLAPRLGEFVELYPEVKLQLLLSDEDLDLGMREADLALRLREPMQPDLIRRRLFTVHFHAYASADYLKKRPQPRTVDDLDRHHLIAFGAPTATHLLYDLNSLLTVGRDPKNPRTPQISVNNLGAMARAAEHGVGIAVLPDYVGAAGIGARAFAATDRHARNGLFSRLCRGTEERRARSGLSRLPGRRRAAVEVLRFCERTGVSPALRGAKRRSNPRFGPGGTDAPPDSDRGFRWQRPRPRGEREEARNADDDRRRRRPWTRPSVIWSTTTLRTAIASAG